MENAYFRYLHVDIDLDALPPEVANDVRILFSLPPQFRTPADHLVHIEISTALRVLEHYLQKATLFQTDDSDTIRVSPRRILFCLDRWGLIEHPAWALQRYESDICRLDTKDQLSFTREEEALHIVGKKIASFMAHRKNKARQANKKSLPHNRTIKKSWDAVNQVFYAERAEKRPERRLAEAKARVALVRKLREDFEEGIQNATDQEIHLAVTAILAHVGVEKGDIPAIAERLRKRRSRDTGTKL